MNKKKQEGKVRGNAIKNDFKYLRDKEGKEALQKIEKALQDKDINISLATIKSMEWYPLNYQVEFLLQTKEVLGWKDKDIFDLGYHAPQYSLLFRIFLKYFASMEQALQNSNQYWGKHFTAGKISYKRSDPNKKEVIFYIENFQIHPILCIDIQGYLKFFVEFLSKANNIRIQEKHCPFKDKYNYHQFNIKWD